MTFLSTRIFDTILSHFTHLTSFSTLLTIFDTSSRCPTCWSSAHHITSSSARFSICRFDQCLDVVSTTTTTTTTRKNGEWHSKHGNLKIFWIWQKQNSQCHGMGAGRMFIVYFTYILCIECMYTTAVGQASLYSRFHESTGGGDSAGELWCGE